MTLWTPMIPGCLIDWSYGRSGEPRMRWDVLGMVLVVAAVVVAISGCAPGATLNRPFGPNGPEIIDTPIDPNAPPKMPVPYIPPKSQPLPQPKPSPPGPNPLMPVPNPLMPPELK